MARRKSSGFTLIEVLVVIAILAILTAVAVPSLLSYLPGYRLRASARDLLSGLRQARTEAVKRNRTCFISFNQAVGGTNYSYIVWFDTNGNSAPDAGEPINGSNLATGVSFDTSQGGGDGIDFPDNRIVFTSRGLASGGGSIWLRNDRGRVRRISLTLAGASRIES